MIGVLSIIFLFKISDIHILKYVLYTVWFLCVTGFFIYKLIKNFMDKEKKREDKKRLKEQKKKK